MRFCVCSRVGSLGKVVGDALRQPAGGHPDIAGDDWDDNPIGFLDAGESGFVPDHFGPARVPVDAFVLCGHPCFGPGEIDSPYFAAPARDVVLKFGPR